MATPADQLQAPAPEPEAGASSSKAVTALWVLGLFTASIAITLAVREPPLPPVPAAGVHKNAYLLALSVAFFAGVAGVIMAAVCIGWPTTTRTAAGRRTTGRKKFVCSAIVILTVVGLMLDDTTIRPAAHIGAGMSVLAIMSMSRVFSCLHC